MQVTSHSIIFAFPHWHDYPEGNKNSGEKKKKLRLRVIELTQKSLAWVAGVNKGERGARKKEKRML